METSHIFEKKILDQIFDGEFYPCKRIVPENPEYLCICRKADEEARYLKNQIREADRMRWAGYQEMVGEIQHMENQAFFTEGFRAGAKLMMELLGENRKENTTNIKK